jgi:transposase
MKGMNMVKYREIIRLSAAGISQQNIAFSCGCAQSTVQVVLKKARELKLEWPLPEEIDDLAIRSILYPRKQQSLTRAAVDYMYVDKELHKRGVTLTLLWNEYCEKTLSQGGIPYQYTQFCDNYKKWAISNEVTMHIDRKPAEQMQVDWAGLCSEVVDPDSSELLKVYIFVASLPYSGYIFAEGFYSMDSEAWISAHIHAFSHFGGVAPIVVPDNCKTAIAKNTTVELIVNENYRRMAEYYGCAIVPARIKRPKDKGHVEMSVGVVERQVIASLRNHVFFSLCDLNEAIAEKIAEINDRPFQKKTGSRTSVFLGQEKDMLIPLPSRPYEIIVRKRVTVNFNYHISFEGTYYSVPFSFVKREVEVAASANTVSINCDGMRIATHIKAKGRLGTYVTNPDHMPDSHRDFVEWDGERFRRWAKTIGVSTHKVIDAILRSRKIEQQSYRSCRGVLSLAKRHSNELLEEACAKAISYTPRPSYKTVKNIASGLVASKAPDPDEHAYLRGANYYENLNSKRSDGE